MLIGLAALESTNWEMQQHAYGRATDTPDFLRALLSPETEGRKAAMQHLWSAILHQGTPWLATEPASLVIVGFLNDPRLEEGESIRPALLRFLNGVVEGGQDTPYNEAELEEMAALNIDAALAIGDETIWDDEEVCDCLHARAVLGCRHVTPVIMEAMLTGLAHENSRVRACAAMGAATVAKTAPLRKHTEEIVARLQVLARAATDSDERSSHVLAIGDLGASTREYLHDPSPGVRMCAALAPALAQEKAAQAELLLDLEQVAEIDTWFADEPPQFHFPWRPRVLLIHRLLERVKDLERLLPGMQAVLRVTNKHCVDFEWGPLLAAAFPDGDGQIHTDAQRQFLRMLVNQTGFWDPQWGNAYKWFQKAGLPYDWEQCVALVDR